MSNKPERGDVVTLTGIERHEGSELHGQLVCPMVNLWRKDRLKTQGQLPHNTAVVIKRSMEGEDGRTYYLVEEANPRIPFYVRKGWVSSWFVAEHEELEEVKEAAL